MQEFTQSGFVQSVFCDIHFVISGVRPFGVSLLVAGADDLGPHLYQVCFPQSCFLFFSPLFSRLTPVARTSAGKQVPLART